MSTALSGVHIITIRHCLVCERLHNEYISSAALGIFKLVVLLLLLVLFELFENFAPPRQGKI